MRSNTIKWRIFKYNLIVIITLIALVAIIFNVSIRFYIERDIAAQLNRIAEKTEETALKRGPDVFVIEGKRPPILMITKERAADIFRFYFALDRSLREPLSVLNADYFLLDMNMNVINAPDELSTTAGSDVMSRIMSEINKFTELKEKKFLNFYLSGHEYIALIKPVSGKNSIGLGWIVIYSSLQKVNQLQMGINLILLVILLISAFIIVLFSSVVAKNIAEPFSTLNQHIRSIAERNFGTKIDTPVYDELNEFVNNINIMSEKLETHDKAQKTFLQNASHEFRTPLMSIQSYAEGIKYGITDSTASADIIIDESKRLTQLVENLLFLSRLDAIEESYCFSRLDANELLRCCTERISPIAAKSNIAIESDIPDKAVMANADGEKLTRAVTNVLSNCIRYAKSKINIVSELTAENKLRITIADDGPGFAEHELSNVFDRFYKGDKGNFGLGLAIARTVIVKHNGSITAGNHESGAIFTIEIPLIK
jgi:two-component system sensor histidine kinase CssS